MEDCIFCKIVRGEIPAYKVYENDSVLAFLDINPVNKGHALVIPKKHYDDIFDISEDDAKAVIAAGKKVAAASFKALNAHGINFINSNKKVAGQEVMHYHMHIIPRYENDGIKVFYHGRHNDLDLKDTTEKIKKAL